MTSRKETAEKLDGLANQYVEKEIKNNRIILDIFLGAK